VQLVQFVDVDVTGFAQSTNTSFSLLARIQLHLPAVGDAGDVRCVMLACTDTTTDTFSGDHAMIAGINPWSDTPALW
jgi:hypothetical protein